MNLFGKKSKYEVKYAGNGLWGVYKNGNPIREDFLTEAAAKNFRDQTEASEK